MQVPSIQQGIYVAAGTLAEMDDWVLQTTHGKGYNFYHKLQMSEAGRSRPRISASSILDHHGLGDQGSSPCQSGGGDVCRRTGTVYLTQHQQETMSSKVSVAVCSLILMLKGRDKWVSESSLYIVPG